MTDSWPPYAFGIAVSASTYLGGLVALRFGRRRDLLFGLTGGMVTGLALLDLLPEALEAAGLNAIDAVFGAAAFGLALYLLLHRLPGGATVGRMSLIAHSVMDGLGIGLAFQVSDTTGWVVAIAVLAHDMADVANIVGITTSTHAPEVARRWLGWNAIAPHVGVVLGQMLHLDEARLALLLALFAGGFLYLGAVELLPRSRSGRGLAAPCRDAKGKFVKCPEKAAAKPAKCKDARGKFAKCGTPGAKPI
jgi:zinc transporter ZupT